MHLVALFSILGALLLGAMSPGPSFVLVVRTSIAASRRDGLAAALGMGIGGLIFGGLALLGLHALLSQVGWLYLALKLVGGIYLISLAIKLWQTAAEPLLVADSDDRRATGLGKSFYLALMTQLSNPKTAVVYGSIFAALLPAQPPMWLYVVLPILIFLIETGWYVVVALTFSSARPRAAYLRSKSSIDRIAGSVMGLLGLRLIIDAEQTT